MTLTQMTLTHRMRQKNLVLCHVASACSCQSAAELPYCPWAPAEDNGAVESQCRGEDVTVQLRGSAAATRACCSGRCCPD